MVTDLEAAHPGTKAVALPTFNDNESLLQLNLQVSSIAKTIKGITDKDDDYNDGYHLVCHSQGALICRCLTEYMNDQNVDTLVSMAGPQLGVYDDAFFRFFPTGLQELTLKEIYHIAYTSVAQATLSVANMWNDPNQQEDYLKDNKFLPEFNNVVNPNPQYKENFLSLKKAVFLVGDIGDSYDGGIGPFQSALFQYPGVNGTMVAMEDSQVYVDDTFGLRSMDERGDLTLTTVDGVSHNQWINHKDIYEKYVFPWLI